jgi:hypothetical protein
MRRTRSVNDITLAQVDMEAAELTPGVDAVYAPGNATRDVGPVFVPDPVTAT